MNRPPTNQQRVRLAGPINFGNCLQPPLIEPHMRSSIPNQDIQKKQLSLYVNINDKRQVEVKINNSMRVSDLVDQISVFLEEGDERPCMFYGQDVMHYNDFLADWEVLDGGVVRVHGRELAPFTITIKLPEVNQSILKITANQTITGSKIKAQIHSQQDLDPTCIKLFHTTVELGDNASLADLGIYGDCTLLLKYCKPKGFNNDCVVRLKDYSNIRIQEIMTTSEVLSFITSDETKAPNKPQTIEEHQAKIFNRVILANNTEVQCSSGVYFYTQDYQWVSNSKFERKRLSIGDKIMTLEGEFVGVVNIHDYQSLNPIDLTYLRLKRCTPYFINDVLISPALDIQVLYRNKTSFRLISVDIHPSMNIADLKGKISMQLRIPLNQQHLFIESKHLMLKDETKISQIYKEYLTIQLFTGETQLKDLIKGEKKVSITFQKVTKIIKYNANAKKTCRQVIANQFPQKIHQFPFFGALYGRKVVDLSAKIEDIVDQDTFYYQNFELMVIKFPERFKLAQILKQFRPQRQHEPTNASIIQTILSIFTKKQRNEDSQLRNYRRNYMMDEVRMILNNLHRQSLANNDLHPKFNYISELIHFLKPKPQYLKKCFRVLPAGQLPGGFTENSIINIREFLSCSPSKEVAQGLLGRNGILFSIQSISGKVIDLGVEGTEVVFLPYTYFLINKVQRQGQITRIQLSEMPTSLAFNKRILLWVDDKPQNNVKSISDYRKKGTEVIQLSSTAMARRWFEEFGWIVNRLNLRMRVVTDMVRLEPSREGDLIQNYEAGIDLIEYLFNERGFTTPVLVFCSDSERGRDNIEKRNIRSNRFHQVTNKYDILKEYMGFQANFESRFYGI